MKTTIFKFLLFGLILAPLLLSSMSFAEEIKSTETKLSEPELIEQAEKKQSAEIPNYAKVFSTESSFQDAKDDLLESIASNGLVVSYTSHAKTMLDNTADVSGVTKSVYDNAEILLFCKADLSHELVAANPHNIVLCPYSIAIYVLTDEPDLVYLSYRNVESSDEKVRALTKPIEDLLKTIIEEVL